MDVLTQIALRVPEPLVEISEQGLATLKQAEQQQAFVRSIHTKVNNSLKELLSSVIGKKLNESKKKLSFK